MDFKLNNVLIALIFSFSINEAYAAVDTDLPQTPEAIVKSYSKDFGVNNTEALRRLKIMQMSNSIAEKIIEKFGEDSIAGFYFDHGNDFKITIRTTKQGQKTRDILRFANKEFPELNIEVIPNSPRNYHAIQNIINNQSDVLMGKIPGFQSLGYSPSLDKLILVIYDPTVQKPSELLSKYKIEKISGMDVDVRLARIPLTPAALIGGATIQSVATPTSGVGACTAGFSVYASDRSTPGILTAYHCTDNGARTSYTLTDDKGIKHNLTLSPPRISGNHDMALYVASTSTPIVPKYFDGGGLYPIYTLGKKSNLEAKTQLNPGGSYLCHYGKTTKFSCGVVIDLYRAVPSTTGVLNSTKTAQLKTCNTTALKCNPTFIAITGPSLNVDIGDSGGPVVDGAIAYGIASSYTYETSVEGTYKVMQLSSLDYISEVPAMLATLPMPF